MDDEFELYKARAYGRYKPFDTQQDTQPSTQCTPQKLHHLKKLKHPRRSRFKPAATEVVICSEKIIDESKRRRHSAMGVTELNHKKNLLPCVQFLPLDEESQLEEVNIARRKSDQPVNISTDHNSSLQFQNLQIKKQKSNNQHLKRQERVEDISWEEEEENKNFRTSKVNFAEDLKEEREDEDKKDDLTEPVGGAKKVMNIDEIKADKKNRRLSCENIKTRKGEGEHKRRFSAKTRNSRQLEASKKEFNNGQFEAKSAENLKKMNPVKTPDNKYPRTKNSRQSTHDITPRQQKPANKLRRSSMFVVPESHSSTHNLSVNKTANKSSILFVSPNTHRRNSGNRSRPSLSPPVSSLNHLSSARRNSAITYLTDVSPSRSKASLLSHGDDGWKPGEPLSTSPAENEEEEVEEEEKEVTMVNILVVGLNGVGKNTLINQLLTAEYLANKNASDPDLNSDTRTSTAVFLEGQSYVVTFCKSNNLDDDQLDDTDACVVTYAVNDRSSFHKAVTFLQTIRKRFSNKRMFVVLTANKQDLVRNRLVQFKEGKKASSTNRCKFMEVSALLDHKVDKLLVNIIKGFILRKERLMINVNGVKVEEDDFGDEDSDNDPVDGDDYEGGKTRNGMEKNCLSVFFRSLVNCLS